MSRLCHINLARGFRGGERQTELLIRELAGAGIAQRAVIRQGQPLVQRLRDVPGLELLEVGKPFTRCLLWLRGNLLHAHGAKGAHLAHWANRLMGVPYVLTRRVDNRPGDNPITRSVYRRASGIAALSKAIAGVLEAHSPGLPVTVIPSACAGLAGDPAQAAELRGQWGGEFVVGQVGALDNSQKGQLFLIRAARQLIEQAPGWRFVFVGGGADEAMLREAAADMDEIVFAGHVENVGDHMAAFDVFAFPSLHEGLGSALLDAMAAGLPIVASDVDGIPEVVAHGEQGILVPSADAQRLADALREMRHAPQQRAQYAASGRARARQYSAAKMAERYLAWYQAMGFSLDRAV